MVLRHLQTLATLGTPLALPVARLSGRWRQGQSRGDLVFAGSPDAASFVARSIFDEVTQVAPVGVLDSPWALRGRAARSLFHGAALAGAELPMLWRAFLPEGTVFRLPAWISQEIRAAAGTPLGLSAALRKEVARHRRREAYRVAYSASGSEIRRFYHELYRPYVTARYGAGAVVVDEARFLEVARGMQLATLYAGEARVAAMLYRQRGTTLALGWFGSATAEPRRGASEVLDAELIERAAAAGIERVILGHSRPSLADGVVRYKARFGAVVRPTRFPQRVIGLAPAGPPSPALVAALNAARFVTIRGGNVCTCVMRPAPSPSAAPRQTAPST